MFQAFYKHSKNFISSYVMPAYSKEVDLRKNCMYLRVLSLYEIVISIYTVLYDPNWATVMTQTGPIISVCYNIYIIVMPTYPSTREHKQTIRFIKFLSELEISDYSYLIYMDNYNHMYSYGVLTDHYSFMLIFSGFIYQTCLYFCSYDQISYQKLSQPCQCTQFHITINLYSLYTISFP